MINIDRTKEGNMEEHLATLLTLIDAELIGGDHPLYVIEKRDNPAGIRIPLSMDNMFTHEGIHLNPKYRRTDVGGYWRSPKENPSLVLSDRVYVQDFDVFNKDGSLKMGTRLTYIDVLDRLKAEGVPLPYAMVPSATPGNFQFLWVYRESVLRVTPRPHVAMHLYWHADPLYTNSVSWSPFYRAQTPNAVGEATRFWTEWTDELPLLDSIHQFYTHSFQNVYTDSQLADPRLPQGRALKEALQNHDNRHGSRAAFRTMELGDMKDGDGRRNRLRSEIIAHFCSVIVESGKPVPSKELLEVAQTINGQYAEPLSKDQVAGVVQRWTPDAQKKFHENQLGAASSRLQPLKDRLEAMEKFFHICSTIQHLIDLHGDAVTHSYNLPNISTVVGPIGRREEDTYTGKKIHAGRLTWGYISHVAGLDDDKKASQLFRDGQRRSYDADLYEITRVEIAKRQQLKEERRTYEDPVEGVIYDTFTDDQGVLRVRFTSNKKKETANV